MRKLIATLLLAFAPSAFAQSTTTLQATNTDGFTSAQSLVKNSGFEGGSRNWTASGGTYTTTTTGPLRGSRSATWDSNGASQTLTSDAFTIPEGLKGQPGVVSCMIQTASGTATHTLTVYDGSANIITPVTITSSATGAPRTTLNFVFPSSGTIAARLTSTASDEPSIKFDECIVASANEWNLSQVNQATLVASGYIPGTASCKLTRTNTALGAFPDVSACPGVTIESNTGPGILQTTDADNADFTVNNLPMGDYVAILDVYIGENSNGTGTLTVALNDGTTTTGNSSVRVDGTGGGNNPRVTITGVFSYTSAGNRTFSLFGAASGSNTIFAENQNATINRINFRLLRFPSTSEIAVRPELLANSWSGKHGADCSLASGTGSSITDWGGDATCTFTELTNNNFGTVTSFTNGGNNSAGIVFTPKKVQRYKVCSDFVLSQGGATANQVYQLADGSNNEIASSASTAITGGNYEQKNICGIFYATSTSSQTIKLRINPNGASSSIGAPTGGSAVNWTIFAIDQSLPAPVLVGSRAQVSVRTGNGFGSTNTKVRRFSTTDYSLGSNITYTDSSTLGGTFTVNAPGVYTACYSDGQVAGQPYIGIVVNGTALTTSVATSAPARLTYAQGLRAVTRQQDTGQISQTICWTGNLNAGDIVYPQSDGAPDSSSIWAEFNIVQVSN